MKKGILLVLVLIGILAAACTSQESDADIAALRYTPSGAFGSCRFKLKGLEDSKAEYARLIEVFKAHTGVI